MPHITPEVVEFDNKLIELVRAGSLLTFAAPRAIHKCGADNRALGEKIENLLRDMGEVLAELDKVGQL